ncbi:MAG: hypothetical protein V4559_00155 [Pseudomonadota bacterium]
MRKFSIVAGIVVAGLSMAGAAVALEASQVTVAYADGYTGTDGQFHAWESRADAQEFRAKHADQYRAWRHDDSRHKNDK